MQNDHQHEHLAFLKDKIKDIRIALFRSDINSELQLPNNIIQVLKVEEDGTIWFFTSCSENQAANIDKSFYAYLNFYKKGSPVWVQVSGNAMIAEEDQEGLFSLCNYSKGTAGRLLLVKMKIIQAEYFENKVPEISWTGKIKEALNLLFLTPSHRVYDFS